MRACQAISPQTLQGGSLRLAAERLEARCLLAADPLGINDFRISHMGPDGTTFGAGSMPVTVYNGRDNQYLVVWSGDHGSGELEIYGQRLNGSTGQPLGPQFRISDVGPDGDANFVAFDPAVAYNSISNEYLVVWSGDDNTGTLVNDDFEIFGQRLSAAGTEIGANDFRISDMGPDGSFFYSANTPSAAYNSVDNEYLVVWRGHDDVGTLVNNELEIFGQRLSAAGTEVGSNDFRISDMGPDGSTAFSAFDPAVAYNGLSNEYLVVWQGQDDTGTLANREVEVFGQRLSAAGTDVGSNDFRISDMGPAGSTVFGGFDPAVAYNSLSNEYLVVWSADDNTGTLVDGEFEIYGQRLNAAGTETGANDFRISDMGPDGSAAFRAFTPDVVYNGVSNEYLVVWRGEDNIGTLVDEEFEIFGQRLSSAGSAVGTNDFRISDMGPHGNTGFGTGAFTSVLAYNSLSNEFLVVWDGIDVDNELEIFGQRLGLAPILVAAADAGGGPHVRVFDGPTLKEKFNFFAYAAGFTGGVRVATGDVTGDGAPDIITAPGPGMAPQIRVFNGTTGTQVAGPLGSFLAYSATFTGGVYVASADVNADGFADIITGAGAGGGPHVRVFSGATGAELFGPGRNFFAYSANFSGGVRVATGDVNGDGAPDIITGAGPSGGPHVRAFQGMNGAQLASFFAFDPTYTGGVLVASGNVNGVTGVGAAEIVVGEGQGGYRARVFTPAGGLLAEVYTFPTGEIRVAVGDVNTDGRADLILGRSATPGMPSAVQIVDFATLMPIQSLMSHGAFTGGNFVAGMSLPPGGSPLRAFGGAVAASAELQPLTLDQLQPSITQALALWQVDMPLEFRIVDLPGDQLGLAFPTVIYIDHNAAGHGWHVGLGYDPPHNRMDVLTVVAHELGHVLGLEDLDADLHADELMAAFLTAGQRRLPAPTELVDAAFAKAC